MAVAGKGTQFRRWNSTSGAWEALAEITSITVFDGMTRETYDTTALDTAGGYRTFIAGFREAGDVSLEMNFTRNAWETLKNDFDSDTIGNYEIVFPDNDNTSVEFEGWVTECPIDVPTDDKISASASIKISGEPTVNSGSGPSPG